MTGADVLDLAGYVEVAPACGDCTFCTDDHFCVRHGAQVADGGHCPGWLPGPAWMRANPHAAAALGVQLIEFHPNLNEALHDRPQSPAQHAH